MDHQSASPEFTAAVEEFRQHENRADPERVVNGLARGLGLLREKFYRRVHLDVEQVIGLDSVLMPVSEAKTQRLAADEIDAFQAAESAATAKQRGYLSSSDTWYLRWVAHLRLAQRASEPGLEKRLLGYWASAADRRRLAFETSLGRIVPESSQSPLVLFQLFPLAVQITTALAFGDRAAAEQLRQEQIQILPAISDCRECHGNVLDLEANCNECGNPLWKYDYLTSS
ncbi:MAG: hypothetical protein HUU20_06775 [Pirellulales bacterium]|nr:hypothetical protein [Pirellulales bacterium]